jgi:hypothetical protein
MQNNLFAAAAATLTFKLRALSFKAILRQDSKWFYHESFAVLKDFIFQLNSLTRKRTVYVACHSSLVKPTHRSNSDWEFDVELER